MDVLQSISRVRGDVAAPDQLRAARRILSLVAIYQEIEDLVNIGAYVAGVSPENDLAVQARPKILQYLQQEANSPGTLEQAKKQLIELANWVDQLEKAIKSQAARPAGRASAATAASAQRQA